MEAPNEANEGEPEMWDEALEIKTETLHSFADWLKGIQTSTPGAGGVPKTWRGVANQHFTNKPNAMGGAPLKAHGGIEQNHCFYQAIGGWGRICELNFPNSLGPGDNWPLRVTAKGETNDSALQEACRLAMAGVLLRAPLQVRLISKDWKISADEIMKAAVAVKEGKKAPHRFKAPPPEYQPHSINPLQQTPFAPTLENPPIQPLAKAPANVNRTADPPSCSGPPLRKLPPITYIPIPPGQEAVRVREIVDLVTEIIVSHPNQSPDPCHLARRHYSRLGALLPKGTLVKFLRNHKNLFQILWEDNVEGRPKRFQMRLAPADQPMPKRPAPIAQEDGAQGVSPKALGVALNPGPKAKAPPPKCPPKPATAPEPLQPQGPPTKATPAWPPCQPLADRPSQPVAELPSEPLADPPLADLPSKPLEDSPKLADPLSQPLADTPSHQVDPPSQPLAVPIDEYSAPPHVPKTAPLPAKPVNAHVPKNFKAPPPAKLHAVPKPSSSSAAQAQSEQNVQPKPHRQKRQNTTQVLMACIDVSGLTSLPLLIPEDVPTVSSKPRLPKAVVESVSRPPVTENSTDPGAMPHDPARTNTGSKQDRGGTEPAPGGTVGVETEAAQASDPQEKVEVDTKFKTQKTTSDQELQMLLPESAVGATSGEVLEAPGEEELGLGETILAQPELVGEEDGDSFHVMISPEDALLEFGCSDSSSYGSDEETLNTEQALEDYAVVQEGGVDSISSVGSCSQADSSNTAGGVRFPWPAVGSYVPPMQH